MGNLTYETLAAIWAASDNNLLKALKEEDKLLILPHIQPVGLERGQILHEPGDDVKSAYFPCGSTLVAYLALLAEDKGVETALIGREGAIGGIVSNGNLPAYCRATVQFPGTALRIETARLEEAKNASVSLRHFFSRYADCLLAQIFQSVACNAAHTIEQRTSKWLLDAYERTGNALITLEQEQLAGMLGVGRSYVARIIGQLKQRGLIETMRGRLRIHRPDQLAKLACGCNHQVKQHFDAVMRGLYS